MNIYIISLFLAVLQSFPACQKTERNSKVKAFVIESVSPEFENLNNEWNVKKYWPVYTKLFFFNDQVMVQESYLNTPMHFENNTLIRRDSTEIRYHTFIFSANDNLCIYMETNRLETAKIVPKDSAINSIPVFDDYIEKVLLSKKLTLISSRINDEGDLIEDYSFKIEDATKPDTMATGWYTLRFSGKPEKNPIYQLSPYVEKVKKRKLVEYRMGVGPSKAGDDQLASHGFEIYNRLSELKIENEAEILKLFEFSKKKLE